MLRHKTKTEVKGKRKTQKDGAYELCGRQVAEGRGRRQRRKAKVDGKWQKAKTEGRGRKLRQKSKAEGEGVDRRIKQTWQRQNTNAEAKTRSQGTEGRRRRERQQEKATAQGKKELFNWERGQSPRNGSKLKGWVANPPTVITLCYALRQNEKGRRKTSKGKCRRQRQKERQRQTGKGKCRRQSMKAEDKDRR